LAKTQEPYLSQGQPPAVVFVCPDEPYVAAALRIADELLLGRIASLEDRPETWPYESRCSTGRPSYDQMLWMGLKRKAAYLPG